MSPIVTRRRASFGGAAAILSATAAPLRAQQAPAWPNRAVRIIVPFQAGGATDTAARLVAARLTDTFPQPFVVENRAGAGGNIGAEVVAKADPDGHTLLMCTIGTASINQFLYSRLPYDAQKDFASISLVNIVANGIILHPQVAANSLQELVALAKRRPGDLAYGTPGNGTSGHLSAEYLKSRTGIDLLHVPYRGTGGVVPELLAGRVQLAVDNLPSYLPHIRENRLRLIAVTSAERWFAVPEVPTVAESGVPGFEAVAWFGLQAPARTPRPIVERLSQAVQAIIREPEVQAKLRDIGSQPVGSTPEEFDRFIAAENAKWQEVVRISGARLD